MARRVGTRGGGKLRKHWCALMVLALVSVMPHPAGGSEMSGSTGGGPPSLPRAAWTSVREEPTRVLSVAPFGDDTASGSVKAPFATLSRAFRALRPGDLLLVRGGTYDEDVAYPPIRRGRPDAAIRVEAYPDEQPILRGVLWLSDPSHWHFAGLQVEWSERNDPDDHMVKMVGGEGWSLTRSELYGARSYAALLVAAQPGSHSAQRWTVADNCIHSTAPTNRENQDHLIYVNSGPEAHGVIEGNVLFGAPNGSGIKVGSAGPDDPGTSHVVIRYNTIAGTSQGILVSWRASEVLIHHNVLAWSGQVHLRGYQLDGNRQWYAHNLFDSSARRDWSDAPRFGAIKDVGGNDSKSRMGFQGPYHCAGYELRNAHAGHSVVPRKRRTFTWPLAPIDQPSAPLR